MLFNNVNKCEIQLSVTCGILNHFDCIADPFITGQTGREFETCHASTECPVSQIKINVSV